MTLSLPWTFSKDDPAGKELEDRLQEQFDRLAQQFPVSIAQISQVPQARVYNNAALAIPNGAATALTFNSERYDTASLHDIAVNPSRLTCATAGLYSIGGSLEWAAAVGGVRRVAEIVLNGATVIAKDERGPSAGAGNLVAQVPTADYRLVAGDYVELLAFQDSGGALNVNTAGNLSPEFWMHWCGP